MAASILPAMHRNKLLALLDGYERKQAAEDAESQATVTRFRRFVHGQPRCFQRDCWEDGHVTGSALVLNPERSSLLLTLHPKFGRWLQLGGHADGETDPLAVASREAQEEGGIAVTPLSAEPVDLDIHAIPARGEEPPHYHYDVRFVLVAETSTLVLSHESLALRWVPINELTSFTQEESILRLVAKSRSWLAL